MKGPQEQYSEEIKSKFGYWATWLPSVPLSLGDIGIVNNGVFTRIASIEDFNLTFEIKENQTEDDLEYSSKGQVSISTKLSGTVSPQGSSLLDADAGFIVEFGNENSIYFKINESRVSLISNSQKLGHQIIDLYKSGKWNKHWAVITEIVKAESSTILISNSMNAKIELKANANINLAKLDIADAKFALGATFTKGLDTKIFSINGLTPLFKTQGIKTRIFLPPNFIDRGIKAFDLLTPDSAKYKFDSDIYFDYIE